MLELLDPAMIAKVLPIIILVNGCLAGLAIILNAVAKYTKSDADDKAASIFAKVLGGLQKIVDMISANPKH